MSYWNPYKKYGILSDMPGEPSEEIYWKYPSEKTLRSGKFVSWSFYVQSPIPKILIVLAKLLV